MSLHKHILAALTVAALFGTQAVSVAQSASATSTNLPATPPRMTQASVVPGEIIGNEQIQRAFVSFGTNEFMFIVPEDMLVRFSQEAPASLTGRKQNFSINFRLLNPLPADTNIIQAQRAWAEAHYKSLQNVEEFTMPVGGCDGTGLLFRQNPEWDVTRVVKIIWAPCKAGVLEFVFVSDASCLKTAQTDFDAVITTFCTNEQGKIKIIPRLDRS